VILLQNRIAGPRGLHWLTSSRRLPLHGLVERIDMGANCTLSLSLLEVNHKTISVEVNTRTTSDKCGVLRAALRQP
jgi:hypothetical protein